MFKSRSEINLLKQANKTAEQGIITGFSAARPGMNKKEIELVVRNWLIDKGVHSQHTLEVKYGKMISPYLELRNEILDGDFLSINLSGWLNNYPFDLKRVKVVGQPTPHQKDYLDHLIEATNWMIQAIVPGRMMTFYPAESRGRLITPIAYELDMEISEVSRINPREQFTLPVGIVLCIAPSIKSPEFGTMTHSEMIVLMENDVKILS
jgi:Xaa-Pro aminopeptidase